jgi:NADH-quinone oxidoreductase subunit J
MLVLLRPVSNAALSEGVTLPPGSVAALQQQQGIVGSVAGPLFETYLVPFEIASVLLLAAIVGAVVLAKRKL